MSIALMHIMPEQVESWDAYQEEEGIEGGFPLPFLIVIAGYGLMLLLDRVLFDAHVGHDDDHVCNPGEQGFVPLNIEKMSLV